MDDENTAPIKALIVELDAGTYQACQCGKSKDYPFCDGSHEGTEFTPIEFTVLKRKKVALCHCGLTKNAPYCDASHKRLAANSQSPPTQESGDHIVTAAGSSESRAV